MTERRGRVVCTPASYSVSLLFESRFGDGYHHWTIRGFPQSIHANPEMKPVDVVSNSPLTFIAGEDQQQQ
jgi:hypothetical protein